MNKIKRLNESYAKHIAVPWRQDAAPAQRVIFCVYDETDELQLRINLDEFGISTRTAAHEWLPIDITKTFSSWLSKQKYANKYFENPNLLSTLMPKYAEYILEVFKNQITEGKANSNTVVAVYGVGSLFGFLKVKDVVDQIAPCVTGRLLVFFPGSYEDNNYRLLDGYDGWNYLAVPLTANKEI